MKNLIRWISMAVLAILSTSGQVKGAAMINVLEFSGGVQATLSGNIDLRATQGFAFEGTGFFSGHSASSGFMSFGAGRIQTDSYSSNFIRTPFGTGSFRLWSTSSGSAFGLFDGPLGPLVGVPRGYQSLAPLNATATANGATLSSLGFTPGTYVSTFSNGNFSDSVTVVIGAPVPEPASFAVFGGLSALGIFGMVARRKKIAAT